MIGRILGRLFRPDPRRALRRDYEAARKRAHDCWAAIQARKARRDDRGFGEALADYRAAKHDMLRLERDMRGAR